MVRFPPRSEDHLLLHNVQTGSGVHLASYTMGVGGWFPRGTLLVHGLRMVELNLIPQYVFKAWRLIN
jgi:hypothetical protein